MFTVLKQPNSTGIWKPENDEDIETAWIGFIRKNYISVLQTNRLCEDIIFTKVSIDQPEGKTYSLQLVFNSEEQQNHFLDEWLPDIEKKINQIFSNRYLSFSSILTEI